MGFKVLFFFFDGATSMVLIYLSLSMEGLADLSREVLFLKDFFPMGSKLLLLFSSFLLLFVLNLDFAGAFDPDLYIL
jgi:hypothetical protein